MSSPHAVWQLTIAHIETDDVLVLDLVGRLSAAVAPELAAALASADGEGRRGVLIDLTAVDYISSAGLRVLQEAAERLHRDGALLAVTGLCEPVRLAFTLAGTIPNLTIFESRDAALEGVKK